MTSPPTPGQTVGPFFAFGLEYDGDSALVPPGSPGAIRLHGRVLDGAGEPVPDALLELWQADADGLVVQRSGSLRRDGYTFTGWGRAATDRTGTLLLHDRDAGGDPAGLEPARRPAVLRHHGLRPRPARPAVHPRVPPGPSPRPSCSPRSTTERRATLVARADDHGFVFDIRLQADDQGEGETVFLSHSGTQD